MEKIRFQLADGTVEEFFIEEQTRIGGVSYLLVSDSMEDEASAYILKDVSKDTDPEACYEMLEDEDELQAVYKVFEQMLEDVTRNVRISDRQTKKECERIPALVCQNV